jgi:hypothetical protein
MSTNINISVGDNKLLDQARLQQNASRQAQLQKEANKRLEAQATDARTKELAALGLDANGSPLTGSRFQVPQIERKPAANRFGEETVSMGWLAVGPNDWRTGSNSNQITTIQGSNLGRTLAISSTDATYWLQLDGIPETRATGAFTPGNPTVYSAPFNTPYFTQRTWDSSTFKVLPLGKGNYMIVIRYEMAYSRVRWNDITPDFVANYAIDMNEYSGISKHYQAFVVSKSSVRQVENVPEQVKIYMDGRVARAVPVSVGNYYYTTIVDGQLVYGYYGVSDWPAPAPYTLSWGNVDSFSATLAANRAGNPNAYPLSGWYVGRMPVRTGPVSLDFGSPAVYSRYTNYSDWTDIVPTATNNYGIDDYDAWFLGLASAVPENKIKNTLGYSRETNSAFYLNAFTLPVYKWQQNKPTENEWFFGPADNPPRPSITDPLYWKEFKILSFSPLALPVPTLPSYSNDTGGVSVPQRFLLTVTDWGAPSYCRQQALALGFTSSDLTP